MPENFEKFRELRNETGEPYKEDLGIKSSENNEGLKLNGGQQNNNRRFSLYYPKKKTEK